MSDRVDELFGEGEGAPKPRTALVLSLLLSGVLTALLGMACTAAPGGVLVLLAWMTVEKEQDRLEVGYLPREAKPRVKFLRTATYVTLTVVVLLFLLQGWLLCQTDFYTVWWEYLLVRSGIATPSV